MTDYTAMSPEDEAKLVPDWVGLEIKRDHRGCAAWVQGSTSIRELDEPGDGYGPELFMQMDNCVPIEGAAELAQALAFFAANGRLPRRLSDGGAV